MNLVPKSVSRIGYRTLLKAKASSPTILVVSGVIGLGATAVLAAKATRNLDPVLDEHKKLRLALEEKGTYTGTAKAEQKAILHLYMGTGVQLAKLYGPTIFVGVSSAAAVLGGHKILRTRHVATMAAYSGLAEQFQAYRARVAKTLGEDVERGIFNGAHGEWEEDPNHKGEHKLTPKEESENQQDYLRPFFDENCPNWRPDAYANWAFLKGVQSHMNTLLHIRGHVFLNDVLDALKLDRVPEGAVVGWLYNNPDGDQYVDMGFLNANNPSTIAFRDGHEQCVRLNFNVDPGIIWTRI